MGKMCMLVACGHPETLGWSPNRYVRPGSVCGANARHFGPPAQRDQKSIIHLP